MKRPAPRLGQWHRDSTRFRGTLRGFADDKRDPHRSQLGAIRGFHIRILAGLSVCMTPDNDVKQGPYCSHLAYRLQAPYAGVAIPDASQQRRALGFSICAGVFRGL